MKMAAERRDFDDRDCHEFSAPYTDYFDCHYDNKGKLLFAEEKSDAIEKSTFLRYFVVKIKWTTNFETLCRFLV